MSKEGGVKIRGITTYRISKKVYRFSQCHYNDNSFIFQVDVKIPLKSPLCYPTYIHWGNYFVLECLNRIDEPITVTFWFYWDPCRICCPCSGSMASQAPVDMSK